MHAPGKYEISTPIFGGTRSNKPGEPQGEEADNIEQGNTEEEQITVSVPNKMEISKFIWKTLKHNIVRYNTVPCGASAGEVQLHYGKTVCNKDAEDSTSSTVQRETVPEQGIKTEKDIDTDTKLLCSVLVQYKLARSKKESHALLKREVLLKARKYTVKASMVVNGL